MELDVITQYVLAITPAVTAILGCAGAAAVCIHRVKRISADSERNVEKARKEKGYTAISEENEQLRRDNAILKENNRILTLKLKGVRIITDEEVE